MWSSLLESKGIQKHERYLLFGGKTVVEQFQNSIEPVECLLLQKNSPLPDKLPSPCPIFFLTSELFSNLDIFGTRSPIAVMKKPKWEATKLTQAPHGIELLLPLGDPSNIGALLRTAWAFGIRQVIMLKEATSPYHPKSVRAASGALTHLKFLSGPSIHELKVNGLEAAHSLLALDQNGTDLYGFSWPQNLRLLVGEEGPGVPASCPALRLSIPIARDCDSLNATVAAAIAISHYRRQFPL
jgi:TrmH family RNA methyltransferase